MRETTVCRCGRVTISGPYGFAITLPEGIHSTAVPCRVISVDVAVEDSAPVEPPVLSRAALDEMRLQTAESFLLKPPYAAPSPDEAVGRFIEILLESLSQEKE